MKHPTVSIIIPVYNEEGYLRANLEAIAGQTSAPYQVIVVDNNSTDASADIARSFPFVTLLRESKQGVVHARNCGFDAATGDIIARIEGDTILEPEWIAKVQRAFANDSDLAAVSGFLQYNDVALSGAVDAVHLWLRARIARYMRPMFVWGANMALRRSVWKQVRNDTCIDGIFHEDLDLAAHLGERSKKVVYDYQLMASGSGRRIDTSFLNLTRYVWVNDRTYAWHGIGIGQRRHMYPSMIVVLAMYPLLRVLYRGYNRHLQVFRLRDVFKKRFARPDPTLFKV